MFCNEISKTKGRQTSGKAKNISHHSRALTQVLLHELGSDYANESRASIVGNCFSLHITQTSVAFKRSRVTIMVLPVPGGPHISTPRGGSIPNNNSCSSYFIQQDFVPICLYSSKCVKGSSTAEVKNTKEKAEVS